MFTGEYLKHYFRLKIVERIVLRKILPPHTTQKNDGVTLSLCVAEAFHRGGIVSNDVSLTIFLHLAACVILALLTITKIVHFLSRYP